jgi:transposase InsO family protein
VLCHSRAPCQQNKNLTHHIHTPTYRITPGPRANLFEEVAMDLITQLPKNGMYNAILTIVNHGCTRAAIFIPCLTTITGEGITDLYLNNVYQWFGLPRKMISDQDLRFTSHFAKALTRRLGVRQNISTAYHPQTDGLLERKNHWVEQYLRFVTTTQQDNWSE